MFIWPSTELIQVADLSETHLCLLPSRNGIREAPEMKKGLSPFDSVQLLDRLKSHDVAGANREFR